MADSKHIKIETELCRDLGLISVLAIGVGTMIAAGIFSLSGLKTVVLVKKKDD